METVNNVASAASKLIWGEGEQAQERTATNETGGSEPVSGEQGKGTVSEPFDKGNSENPISGEPTPSTSASTTTPGPNPTSAAAGGVPRPEHETSKTGVVGDMGSDPKGSDVRPSESAAHAGAAPESGAAPTQKQQGAANPTDEPETAKSKSNLNVDDIDGEEALKKKDPNDHSGEPMHMHGGDGAGAGEEKKKATKIEDRRESKAGQAGGQELGKEEHGTGEQWVKTTGLAAEGGDFDATKPGAGREADRLLEQKGIHKPAPGEAAKEDTSSTTSPSPAGTKEKVSVSEKIKNKLHIGHKDKS